MKSTFDEMLLGWGVFSITLVRLLEEGA